MDETIIDDPVRLETVVIAVEQALNDKNKRLSPEKKLN
jgi:hypothetical protein